MYPHKLMGWIQLKPRRENLLETTTGLDNGDTVSRISPSRQNTIVNSRNNMLTHRANYWWWSSSHPTIVITPGEVHAPSRECIVVMFLDGIQFGTAGVDIFLVSGVGHWVIVIIRDVVCCGIWLTKWTFFCHNKHSHQKQSQQLLLSPVSYCLPSRPKRDNARIIVAVPSPIHMCILWYDDCSGSWGVAPPWTIVMAHMVCWYVSGVSSLQIDRSLALRSLSNWLSTWQK